MTQLVPPLHPGPNESRSKSIPGAILLPTSAQAMGTREQDADTRTQFLSNPNFQLLITYVIQAGIFQT